jgi:hypothetical protein
LVGADVDTRPVGPDDLADLARLFESQRNTRRCWCMAFCESRSQFAVGWLNGGNRDRFETMVMAGGPPMGILASVAGEPVGWCACGPRSRYAVPSADEASSCAIEYAPRTKASGSCHAYSSASGTATKGSPTRSYVRRSNLPAAKVP